MKHLRLISIIVAVLILGWLVLRPAGPTEPSYQGRALSAWLNDWYDAASYINGNKSLYDATEASAKRAVKGIGTNAIPALLQWLQITNAPLRVRINFWLRKYPIVHFQFRSRLDKQNMPVIAFKLLGRDGLPAVPDLVKLARSPDNLQRFRAMKCLSGIDNGDKILLPVYLELLHDSDPSVRLNAAYYLAVTYPKEAEKAGVYKMKDFGQLYPKLKPPSANTIGTNTPTSNN